MDTMTFTKAVGAICGAWLILLLGTWAATELYEVDSYGEQAYVIDTGDAGEAEAEVEEADPPIAELLASADVDDGASLFRRCSACHKLEDGANGTGPHLYAVVDRPIGAVDGFNYSGALPADQAWTPENLSAFLKAPRDWAPGTTMSYSGMRDIEDRANIIAYLQSIGG